MNVLTIYTESGHRRFEFDSGNFSYTVHDEFTSWTDNVTEVRWKHWDMYGWRLELDVEDGE